MAKYLYLCVGGEAVPDAEQEALMGSWMSYMGALAATGKLRDGAPLSPNSKRLSSETEASDYNWTSPNAISGYWIMEVADLAEAQALAKGCPHFSARGQVDILEIVDMPMPS
jgi:hypothetical protein